jgi:hypothetical protein
MHWRSGVKKSILNSGTSKGSPSPNAYVERFNRTFREDILDPNTFITAGQAQARANDWMWNYNFDNFLICFIGIFFSCQIQVLSPNIYT